MTERRRSWSTWAVILVGALVVVLVAGAPSSGGPPLDPGSSAPSGTKALVEMLRELGTDVAVTSAPPDSSAASALVLSDRFSERSREDLLRWVDRGGTLLVADPGSPLAPARPERPGGLPFVERVLRRQCRIEALRDVERLTTSGAMFPVPPGATGCFRPAADDRRPGDRRQGDDRQGDDEAWMLVAPRGRGHVVATGGSDFLTNEELGEGDNAVLAAAVLAPRRGGRTVVVRPGSPGAGRRGLIDLVSSRVKLAVLQLVLAFLLLAWWRARRLGRPVVERRPVELAGSETVAAVGRLMQRARAREQAAHILCDDLGQKLRERFGLPAGTPVDTVAAVAARRSGVDEAAVRRALIVPPLGGEGDLVELAQTVESVADPVLHAR